MNENAAPEAGSKIFDKLGTRFIQVAIDIVICTVAFAASYLLRFDGDIPEARLTQFTWYVPIIVGVRSLVHVLLGIYRVVWRYVSVGEVLLFARSVLFVTAALLGVMLAIPKDMQPLRIPISIVLLEGTFTFIGMTVSRVLRRIIHERKEAKAKRLNTALQPVLLVGAGQGGLAMAKEMFRHPELGMTPLGFLDDDSSKTGMHVAGFKVWGTLAQVEDILRRTRVKQIIITTSKISPQAILRLVDGARGQGAKVRTVPGLYEMLHNEATTAQPQRFREVQIEDLLSRDPVAPSMSMDQMRSIYENKRIFVTGAGGSIGSELCRQLISLKPKKLILVERDENNLFEIHRELTKGRIDDVIVPALCDISRDKDVERFFREHAPEVVFHAAAFKHVPMMEKFPTAAIRNNVFGTRTLAELSDKHNVERFVMISTDKAVKPTSVMGASKRLAEMIVQNLGKQSQTKFSCVRFGNVLGSRGSVIPIFRQQIEAGGPVTVTHPEATRYFMTIPEAANLVMQAGSQGSDGEVFLLDMGEPVKIIDLARQMIHLMGLSEDICPIKITGTRPGEKLYEELRTEAEEVSQTPLRKIFRVNPERFAWPTVEDILGRLDFAARASDQNGVRQALTDLGIGYIFTEAMLPQSSGSSVQSQSFRPSGPVDIA